MKNNTPNGDVRHQADRLLADEEKRLRGHLRMIVKARSALGVRKGRKPKVTAAR